MTGLPTLASRSERDLRLDFFRGLALLFIFMDHIPGNSLSYWTLHAFGVSDAAEVFVIIAGYSAFSAYSNRLERQGLIVGSRAVLLRVRDIFAAHLFLVALCATGLAMAARYFENPLYYEYVNLTPFSYDPLEAISRTVLLTFQLGYLNILPLYVVLLAWFPVLWWMLQRNIAVALGVSVAMWIAARHGLNLPSWPETIGWFFNPFAWQFLFALGAAAALCAKHGKTLPRSPWLVGVASAYVGFNVILAAPWIHLPGLDVPRIIPLDWIPTISKTNLSLWRLAHILALSYLAALVVPHAATWLRSRPALLVVNCGRNSLDIFCLATVLSFIGFVVLLEGDRTWPYQVTVNAFGLGAMLCAAKLLTWRKTRRALVANAATPQTVPLRERLGDRP